MSYGLSRYRFAFRASITAFALRAFALLSIVGSPCLPAYAQAPGQGPVELRYTHSAALINDIQMGLQAALGRGPVNIRVYGLDSQGLCAIAYRADRETRFNWSLNCEELAGNAITAWTRVPFAMTLTRMGVAAVPAESAQSRTGIDLVIAAAPAPNTAPTTLATTSTHTDARPRRITLYLSNIAQAAANRYDDLARDGIIAEDANATAEARMRAYVTTLVQSTIMHELGHAFGLEHPEVASPLSDELLPSLPGNRHEMIGNRDVEVAYHHNPSLMTSDFNAYVRQLNSRYRRAISLDDIRPSNRDVRGVTLLWRARPQPVSTTNPPGPSPPPRPTLWDRFVGGLSAIAHAYPHDGF